jgi:RNA polymerase sporulation-specific sigma factor
MGKKSDLVKPCLDEIPASGYNLFKCLQHAAQLAFSPGKNINGGDGMYSSIAAKIYITYAEMTDEEIVALAQQGEQSAVEYLVDKYRNFVRAKARSYFLIGADKEDIIQEGMIGLFKAIRDYKVDKLTSFRAFAELCITRQIITAIKTATRQKHIPLNSYVSLNKPIYDEESDRTLMDIISTNKITNPEDIIISREEFIFIERKMGEILSSLEWKVLMAYLEGKSYQEIAVELKRHVKSIDNTLQRVKRKLEKYLEDRNEL